MPSPLQGFDQIVAVSQDQINASLDARFSLDPQSLEFNAQTESGDTMSGIMNPPTVKLFIESEPFKCRFCLHFDSGSFTYYTVRVVDGKPEVVTHECAIDKWTLAFTVNLGLDKLNSVPKEIADKIRIPGSYSVSQLLLDFTTADLMSFDRELSDTPGIDVPLGQDPERDDKLSSFIRIYLEQLTLSTDHNILGYAVTVPDPSVANPIAPSLPPTSVQFQTMDFRGSAPSNIPKGGLDCFLFLEMTDHRSAPHTLIDWSWNFVEPPSSPPSARDGGCMVIAKANFWDAFFVPRATFLNREALDVLNRIAAAFDQKAGIDDGDVPWSLTPSRPGDSALAWKSTTATSMKWNWSYHTEGGGELNPYWNDNDTQVTVALETGANAIRFTANTHIRREEHHIIPGRVPIRDITILDAKAAWGFVFTLTSVRDGALGVDTTPTYSVSEGPQTSVDWTGKSNVGGTYPTQGEMRQSMKEYLDRVMEKLDLATDVAEAFETHSQFVFPGGGTFFMKDPQFNEDGDVVVGLTYKQE